MVSRVVWEHVVSPGWLEKPDTDTGFRWGDLFRAAEAMFPIVALVCTRILSARYYYVGSYGATMSAASVPAPSCVAWILNNRQNGRLDQRIAGIRLLGLDHHPTAVMTATTTTTTTTEPTPDGGDSMEIGARKEEGGRRRLRDGNDDDDDDDGDEDDVYAREVGATVVKEVSTTVAGLLIGGHVGIAELLLGGGARIEDHDGDGGGVVGVKKKGTLPRLWDGRSVVRWGNACRTTNDNGLRLREKVIEYLKTESGVACRCTWDWGDRSTVGDVSATSDLYVCWENGSCEVDV
ncbi:hypothetical protein Pelo_17313 [Pelomyxa schiedti]|nr:hypothetical protein Pelo_17313 [Pelomyxa schiedti]